MHFRFRNSFIKNWQLSHVSHIGEQLSPLAFGVKQLTFILFNLPPTSQRKADPEPWLKLLTPYNDVEEIRIDGPCIGFACALQQSAWETSQELLPALRVLRIHDFGSRSICLTMLFAAARQLNGRPVIVHCLDEDDG